MARQIKLFDTTLRDGEQSPGCSMNLQDKLEVAESLASLGVDIIEAGFAIASPGDFKSVQAIAKTIRGVTIASLSRALEKDIDASWEALREAESPRIHTFLATSPLHMEYKLKKTPDQVYEQAVAMVKYARNLCGDVEFSLEDASRSEPEFMYRVIEGVIAAGASTVNIPDTVGYAVPEEYAALIRNIRNNVPNVDKAVLSVHCHNDLGLGVANSLAAALAGADQIECTINGLGERAGNAALEEIVMNLYTRKEYYNMTTRVDSTRIWQTSRKVSKATGVRCQPNKAIVGDNAFAHESGIHQHGVLANRATYEIMTPESIGLPHNKMVLGKHSGRHAFEERLAYLGHRVSEERLNELFEAFKELADKKKTVSDRDIEAMVSGSSSGIPEAFQLDRFVINSGSSMTATSVVRLKLRDGTKVEKVAIGDGPVDASFNAVDKIIGGSEIKLEDYNLQIVDATDTGADAQGESHVRITRDGRTWNGSGVSTDIVESSLRAYLFAINAMLYDLEQEKTRSAQ
ncbi:MAG TPA: 2-isopropylmalate synthase [Treponemataceae bacterium]|mgnify:FL=1|jgi:2-isopropylmalate synthase|nr:2-isopropylmalate synthase [Treponemataceae bacterium]HOS36180.1 2-isopropylmalate synthase [Treponemataceae bacterium]HOU37636.1 2-isopropylmalate synthase [Treponemataceae bacterium]HPA09290.1 2-isopropylmalate synthase [Treponemataceae bacterium]HPL92137.1 2-isopropylmalate synthase [Treponemataceae bacterium]